MIKLSDTALRILEERYLEPGETVEERFHAIAEAINPDRVDEYYNLMANLDFLPNTPTIINAGRGSGQLSACFVVPVNDSMHDILTAAYNVGTIQKTGGGTGFTLSRLRPKGAPVSSTRGRSSGPISFLHMYDAVTDTIEQGGARRGANMATMRCDHPDIFGFITCKEVEGELKNFNVSVMLTDAFMEALGNNQEVPLIFDGKEYDRVPARKIFDALVEHAWQNGEPGVLFIDTINKSHPRDLGVIDATNPCGEQELLDYESCNLGSINLVNMLVKDGNDYVIDRNKLRATAKIATAFLDDVISVNKYPLPEIKEATLRTRKIGLGIMGWGDALIKIGAPYDSTAALSIADTVMTDISSAANEESFSRGAQYGHYPAWESSHGLKYRNATRTTIAPTGSLATIAGVSYGIEPLFGLTFRKKMVDKYHTYVNSDFIDRINEETKLSGRDCTEIVKEVLRAGTCQHVSKVPQHIRSLFKTAQDISYEAHIRMQAAFQKHTNNAVSKTINFPSNATKEDFERAILLAYELGCKGLTMYRAGSRKEEAVVVGTTREALVVKPVERPTRMYGFTEKCSTGCGKLYITVNSSSDGVPMETFIEPGSDGGCEAYGKALSRVISLGLRSGVSPWEFVKQLRKVSCKNFVRKAANGGLVGKSCPDVVGRILESVIEVGAIEATKEVRGMEAVGDIGATCPNCGSVLLAAEGCWVCQGCGYNRCE